MGSNHIGHSCGDGRTEGDGEEIPDETINSIKLGLMGPFAGIGDTINWATLLPILLGFLYQ